MAKHPAVGFIEEALRHLNNDHCAGQIAAMCLVKALEHMQTTRPPTESEQVAMFSLRIGQLAGDRPRHLTGRKLAERADFLREEVQEFVDAAARQDLAEMADALVDVVYVAKGTALMMGLPWDEHWAEVQRANMDKVPGPSAKRRTAVDAVKPPGWRPPDHASVLRAAGYDPSAAQDRHDDAARGGVVREVER